MFDDYLKVFTDVEDKDFIAINFSEYFKSIREEQYLRKATKTFYIFLTTPDEVETYMQSNSCNNCIHRYNVEILNHNSNNPELQLINTKPMIIKIVQWVEKVKVQIILALDYKKRNDCKIFYSRTKLTASDSNIDEAFKSMHQSVMTKIKNYACKDWIVLDVIIKHSIRIFEC